MFTCKVFSVFDCKANAFLQPFFSPTTATALRSFERSVQDESSDFHRYAGDYSLFEIGEWNQNQGTWVSYEAKVNLGLASQFVEVAERALREVS